MDCSRNGYTIHKVNDNVFEIQGNFENGEALVYFNEMVEETCITQLELFNPQDETLIYEITSNVLNSIIINKID